MTTCPVTADVTIGNFIISFMVDIIVFAVSKPPAFAKNWPLNVKVSQDGAIADVKAMITNKYPKVSLLSNGQVFEAHAILVLYTEAENLPKK